MIYNIIKEAVFLSRPNRFVANVIVDGEEQTVHVKNTGRCKELLYEGVTVYLEDHGEIQATRKTRYSLVAVEKADKNAGAAMRLINIDSYAPNRVVGEALADGSLSLPEFGELIQIRPETTYGNSRFDFYLEDKVGQKAYLEVKGVTLEDGGIARFPDAPTERGIKHIKELGIALEHGFRAYLVFVIQMKGISRFEPNDVTHFAFGTALREAQEKGVILIACDCDVTENRMTLGDSVKIKL